MKVEDFMINGLMKQYFINKDVKKTIKSERLRFMETFKYDCGDCIKLGLPEVDLCEQCKIRHQFYLDLKEIQHKNTGIMLKIRHIVLR